MAAVDSSAARGGFHGTIEAAERRFGKGTMVRPRDEPASGYVTAAIVCAVGGFGRNG